MILRSGAQHQPIGFCHPFTGHFRRSGIRPEGGKGNREPAA